MFPEGVDTTDSRNGKLTPIIAVTPGYFAAAGCRNGNAAATLTDHDDANASSVAVVNQALADGSGQDKIRLVSTTLFWADWDVEVVGIVQHVKYN